jgi:tetratricopeptide (TPR) repeat protein
MHCEAQGPDSTQLASQIRAHVADPHDPDRSERAQMCRDLAAVLWRRWSSKGEDLALQAIIKIETEQLHLCHPTDADRAVCCASLAFSLETWFNRTGEATMLDESIGFSREALGLRPVDHPDRHISCNNLANSLLTRFSQTGDSAMLDEAIKLNREALALRPVGHPDRHHSYNNLAISLRTRFNQTGDSALLDEAIMLDREVLTLRHVGHPDRYISCNNLAISLWTRFSQTGDSALLDEAIKLNREALDLQPVGHPHRHHSCNNLATSLQLRFGQTGDSAVLNDVIELEREALALRPVGHPDRHESCNNLAISLRIRFSQTGDSALLDEAIMLDSEALALRPVGHPHRHHSCNNLASSLRTRFNQTGDSALLNDAIELEREALTLQPVGHPHRHHSCNNLASSLWTRFSQTGDSALLDEAIKLHREALALRPDGHPDRHISCNNLAGSLRTRFSQTGDSALLDEAIMLDREALALQPVGHPDRHHSCNNLASSLQIRFSQTGDSALLDEAIKLHREALALQPIDHPDRYASCINLAVSLRYSGQFHEAAQILQQMVSLTSPTHPGRWRVLLQYVYLDLSHPDYAAAVSHLNDMLTSPPSDIPDLLSHTIYIMGKINYNNLSQSHHQTMLQSHAKILDLVTLSVGYSLERSEQLDRAVANTDLGSHALVFARQANDLPLGLELLERARGILWSQMLHLRDPQINRVPVDLGTQLEAILRSMSPTRAASTGDIATHDRSFLSERDVQHQQRSQLQHILQDIRSRPGLHDFMRGPDSHSLLTTAARSPVVVLVTHENDCHALIIRSPDAPLVDIQLKIDTADLRDLTFMSSAPQQRGSSLAPADDSRAMHVSRKTSASQAILAKLWRSVVKPVITHLDLVVSRLGVRGVKESRLTAVNRSVKEDHGRESTGVQLARSCSYQCTRQGSTKAPVRSAAQTVSAQGSRLCSLDDMYIDACDSLTHSIASGLCSYQYIVSSLVVCLYQRLQGSAPVPNVLLGPIA